MTPHPPGRTKPVRRRQAGLRGIAETQEDNVFTEEQVRAAWFADHCEDYDSDEMAVRGREVLASAKLVVSANFPAGAATDFHRTQLGQVDSPVLKVDAGYVAGGLQYQLVALREVADKPNWRPGRAPGPPRTQLNLPLPAELIMRFRTVTALRRVSMTPVMANLIERWLEENEVK